MQTSFIRYHYLERTKFWYRLLWIVPTFLLRSFLLNPCFWKQSTQTEGSYEQIEMTLPFEQTLAKKMKEPSIWKALQRHMQKQEENDKNCIFLLDRPLFIIYLKNEKIRNCYPNYMIVEQLETQENRIGMLFYKYHSFVWIKQFFLKELVEYYRVLYGIRKKVFRLLVIEGTEIETKRAIQRIYSEQNYMNLVTKRRELYESLVEEILEETGLSILVTEQPMALSEEEKEKTLLVNMNDLFPDISQIEVTQCGIPIELPLLVASLLDRAVDETGTIKEEKLEEIKRNDRLYLKKVRLTSKKPSIII